MPDIPDDNLSFEQALAELEQIVRALEDGQVGLEDSLARYEKGVGLLKRCYGQLRQAEQRIQLLAGVDEDGKPVARPFQHNSTEETAKPRPVAEDVEKPRPQRRKMAEEPGLF
jgi:exodeoxyribonuclease VII small subunit